ncbi:hypothetical protein QNA08_07355 [Chelatococcus sp. SYSU_G07232]|uniref:Uncharacterized protein n=1 Tax=Chelatococcus albus TaxID=3047466 RepID=A0ABT7AGT5_9HYPH|nr:hypothetical protein [Chelatococcus sp. SYSU_G07232]MDJ1158049.1 hypothetical protein [Chelatococcus sp. SYSU_G07232]
MAKIFTASLHTQRAIVQVDPKRVEGREAGRRRLSKDNALAALRRALRSRHEQLHPHRRQGVYCIGIDGNTFALLQRNQYLIANGDSVSLRIACWYCDRDDHLLLPPEFCLIRFSDGRR